MVGDTLTEEARLIEVWIDFENDKVVQ